MATDVTMHKGLRPTLVKPRPGPLPAALEAYATALRLRAGQNTPLTLDGGEIVLIVRSGMLTLQVTLPGVSRQIIAIAFPSEVICTRLAPLHASAIVTAASGAELWRLRRSVFDDLASRDAETARFFRDALVAQAARQAIHIATLGQLSGEQRVATLYVELALRAGSEISESAVFNMPLCRKDVADYLGLNADTLSRIISRLRRAGIIGNSERDRVVVRDFRALMRLTPAAESLVEMI